MTASRVQTKTASKTTASTSTTVTFNTPTASGNLVVATLVFVNGSSTTVLNGVADSVANDWQWATSFASGLESSTPASYTGGLGSAVAYVVGSPSISSMTFTYPSCQKFFVQVTEVFGAGDYFDATAGAVTGLSVPSDLSPEGGIAFFACCTNDATTITGGWNTLLNTTGNLAGYKLTTGSAFSLGWTPSQTGSLSYVVWSEGDTTTEGTATLTETESLTAKAALAPTATLTEVEAISAVGGSFIQAEFSALATDQSDENGIPGRKGLTTYHWASTTSTSYDRYASLQEGRLVSGPYNAAPDTNLYRTASGQWTTDGSLVVGNDLTVSDDLTVTDDASVGGDLTVTGGLTVGGQAAVRLVAAIPAGIGTNTNYGPFTAETNMAALTVSNVPLVSGVLYRATFAVGAISSVDNDVVRFRIRLDSITGTIVGGFQLPIAGTSTTYKQAIVQTVFTAPDTATHDFLITAQRAAGGGNITAQVSQSDSFATIERLGN